MNREKSMITNINRKKNCSSQRSIPIYFLNENFSWCCNLLYRANENLYELGSIGHSLNEKEQSPSVLPVPQMQRPQFLNQIGRLLTLRSHLRDVGSIACFHFPTIFFV